MPTKKRVQKENETKAAYKKQVAQLGATPDYLQKSDIDILGNSLSLGIDGKKTIFDTNFIISGDDENSVYLHENFGEGGRINNEKRASYRKTDALELKGKYPKMWGNGAFAAFIAKKENLSIRTVQKYFKDFP